MKPKVIPTIILLTILFIVFFIIYMKFYNERNNQINNNDTVYKTICGKYQEGEVKFNDKIIKVIIANNDCKRSLGLSGKMSLNNEGMLFIFEKSGNYSFWMKDMNFPLDILWINEDFSVVGIEKNVATSTYPKVFGEKYKAKYVLEISAGNSQKNNIKIGDGIIYSK